jgi:hypothetical protein
LTDATALACSNRRVTRVSSYPADTPAYGLDALRSGLDRSAFLLGGSDGEDLFGPDQR